MTSSTEGKGSMTEGEAAEALKKKSLSKYGPFNQSIHASRGNDSDEEYGIVVPEEGDDDVKFNKKSLSKFASHSVDPTVTKKSEDDDDYGAFDPSFKLEKVAHTAKGELVVVPENTTPKTIKKTLSKYGTPSSVQKTPASVRSADSDDDYGALESNGQPKKIKKTLSKYSPKNSTNKLEGKLSFEEIKVDSDEEYGELDPNFKPVPVAVTSSGHFVVPPEPASEKKIKKTLSKYKDSSMSAEKPVTVSSTAGVDVLKSRDSDEEYGNDIDTSYLDSAKTKSRKTVHQNSSASKSHSISQSHSISVSKSRSDDTTFSNGEVSTEHLAPVKALVAKIEKNKVNN